MLSAPVGGAGITRSSAMADRPRVVCDFNGVGHFEATFYFEELHFVLMYLDS